MRPAHSRGVATDPSTRSSAVNGPTRHTLPIRSLCRPEHRRHIRAGRCLRRARPPPTVHSRAALPDQRRVRQRSRISSPGTGCHIAKHGTSAEAGGLVAGVQHGAPDSVRSRRTGPAIPHDGITGKTTKAAVIAEAPGCAAHGLATSWSPG